MKCNKCKSEVEPHAIFCIYCGNDVSKQEPSENIPDTNDSDKYDGRKSDQESSMRKRTIIWRLLVLMIVVVGFVNYAWLNWETKSALIAIFVLYIADWLLSKLKPNRDFYQNRYPGCLYYGIVICGLWIGFRALDALYTAWHHSAR